MYDIWGMIQDLYTRVQRLEAENEMLKQQLQTAMRIKRLQYHIEELHVRNLRGTLNIGITSNGTEQDLQAMVEDLQNKENGPFHLKGNLKMPIVEDDENEDQPDDEENPGKTEQSGRIKIQEDPLED